MKLFKSKKEKIREECWEFGSELVKWLNEHLKVYKEDAGEIIDLTFYKFTYKRKKYTQGEIVDRLIEITDYILEQDAWDYDCEELEKAKNEMYDLMKLVHWAMWW